MGQRHKENTDPYLKRLNEKIRKSEIATLRVAGKVSGTRQRIARRERDDELDKRFDWMCEAKASTLHAISNGPSHVSKKDQWYRFLDSIVLTQPGADAKLKKLLEEVEREKRFWSNEPFKLPEWMKGLTPGDNGLSTKSESTPKKRASFSVDAVEWSLEQEQRERELDKELIVSALGLIASSLESLISLRKLYESALSNL